MCARHEVRGCLDLAIVLEKSKVFPFADLTPEILARILDVASDYMDRRGKRHCDVLQLVVVCKHWHDLIFNSPQLWCHLYLDVAVYADGYDCGKLMAYLRRWFGEAGALPLELRVSFQSVDNDDYTLPPEFLEYLPEVPDWRELYLEHVSDVTLPRLLRVAQGSGRRIAWPKMKSLTVKSTPGEFDTNDVTFTANCDRIIPNIEEFNFISRTSIALQRSPLSELHSGRLLTLVERD